MYSGPLTLSTAVQWMTCAACLHAYISTYMFVLCCCRWTAAASRPILLKQCLQLPKPLWKEVLECMGGEYATAAREDIIE